MGTKYQITKLIDEIIQAEGGDKYTNNPADRGGPTKFGITEATARAYGYLGDMQALYIEKAREIYAARYWSGPRFDEVEKVSTTIAVALFSFGVNSGPSTAAKALQRALNACGDDITIDGNIGKMTIYAMQQVISKRGEEFLINLLEALWRVRYVEIVENDKTQKVFFAGWQNRVTNCLHKDK